MKFMKLGSKPDAFQTQGCSNIRYIASELPTDVTIDVGDARFYLHKFPLLSKSGRLQKLIVEASEEARDEIRVDDFPGGSKSFELCAKFCYGMSVTLNAYNVVAVRCAAEFLEMTEDIDKGNLMFKIDVFLSSSLLRSWKDSIIVLHTTTAFLPWSEDLKIVGKCIESIASKIAIDPCDVHWSYTYNRKSDQIVERGVFNETKAQPVVPRDWWIEDLCDLEVGLYKRVMVAVKTNGRTPSNVIGEALRTYAIRWLPNSTDMLICSDHIRRNRSLLENIIWLLPSSEEPGCSSSFLLKLLKVAILIGIEDSLKEELLQRIGSQLEKACVRDLLIPPSSPGATTYDVDLVRGLLNRFVMHERNARSYDYGREGEKMSNCFVLGHGSLLAVGKLIDGYLAEVASDPNLGLSSFVDLSRSLPEVARPTHDGLYAAIDIYLQEHVGLTKAEKKRLCSIMDVRKLSTDASLHAAQNERLPLRVIVQVLYFEQVRSATADGTEPSSGVSRGSTRSTSNIEDDCRDPALKKLESLTKQIDSVRITDDKILSKSSKNSKSDKSNRSNRLLLPSRSRRIFDKLWIGRMQGDNNKSSETSGSSSPPASVINNPGEAKSIGSSSRNRRHSVS